MRALPTQRRICNWLTLLGIACLCSQATPSYAEDWPQWLGAKRDAIWRETGIVDKFPSGGPTIKWRTPIEAGYAGPAVANGKVYVTDRVIAKGTTNPKDQMSRTETPGTERVICLNEADGKVLWDRSYNCPYSIAYPLGPRTTPIVQDGKVYTLGAEGNLVCLNAESGSPVWEHDLKKEYQVKAPLWGFSSHPLIDGNKLYCIVGGEKTATVEKAQPPVVVAFDKDSGKELWHALSAKEPGYCPPMIFEAGGKRQLIIWDGDSVNGLDPETGKVYWTQPAAPSYGMAISTPRKADDMLFVTGYMDCAVMLRLAQDHPASHIVWRGDKKKKTGFYSVFSTPFIEAGYIYGTDGGGILRCIKASDGERVWESMAPTNGKKLGSADNFLIKNGDRFFIVNEKGDLIIARLTPKAYQEISRAHILDPDSQSKAFGRTVLWTHPAFADRCAFMRNDKEIVCVSLASETK
jgi:outer membrane protein assembly factor BamB